MNRRLITLGICIVALAAFTASASAQSPVHAGLYSSQQSAQTVHVAAPLTVVGRELGDLSFQDMGLLTSASMSLRTSPMRPAAMAVDYDFTVAPAGQTCADVGMATMTDGSCAMIGGDGNADGSVTTLDIFGVWTPTANSVGYLPGDFNLDGSVTTLDIFGVWTPSANSQSQVDN